jgi:hypothetical protein
MKTAAEPFKRLIASGWKPGPEMANPDNFLVRFEVPAGPVTVEGTRRNARMVVEYVEGWLTGRGAKGIDSLAGKPGVHPALMEDLATGRMSVAQIAQRIRHRAKDSSDPSKVHDFASSRPCGRKSRTSRLLPKTDAETEDRYGAARIAMRWIRNYTDLDSAAWALHARRPRADAAALTPSNAQGADKAHLWRGGVPLAGRREGSR